MNEGCWNCGTYEFYNGAEDNDIRYLCGICVMCGLVPAGMETFELVEASLKAIKPTQRRFNRKSVVKRGATLATY
jgi:hypothetical protein